MWLEWRPASAHPAAKDVEEAQEPWTRLNERPPRIIAGEVLVSSGAVELDVDTLAGLSIIVCPPTSPLLITRNTD